MFGNIIDALQGPAAIAVDSDSDTGSSDPSSTQKDNATDLGQAAPVLTSIWGMASKIADTVRKGTAEIAASVTETDWKAELEAFGKEVAEDAQEASAYTVERLEALPDSVRHVPDKLTHLPPVDSQHVQQSLQQVGSRLRGLGASLFTNTATLLEQVQDAIAQEIESIDGHINRASRSSSRTASRQTLTTAKYSRLDADISAMQRNSSTYCDEPEDAVDYNSWLSTFDLSSKKHDIQQLTSSNAFMSELQSRIVPLIVQYEVFWTRYFYQLHKLQQKHEQLQALAQRAAKASEEEEVGWDDDEAAPTPRANAKIPESCALSADSIDDSRKGLEETFAANVTLQEPERETVKVSIVTPMALTSKDSIGDDPSCSSSPVKGREDEAETYTASDDSGNGHGRWTVVVKAPKQSSEPHRDERSPTPPSGVAGPMDTAASGAQELRIVAKPGGVDGLEAVTPTEGPRASAQESKAESTFNLEKPGNDFNDGSSDIDSADLELSDDDGPMPDAAGAGSDVDEDWGSWE